MNHKGQSLFEVIFAIGIAAVILVAIASLAAKSIANSTFSKNNALASKYAQEGSECLREQRDNALRTTGWNAFKLQATNTKCLNGAAPNCIIGSGMCDISGTPFRRGATFSNVVNLNGEEIRAIVIVQWSDGQGTHQVRNITTFTNWNK